MKQQRNMEKCVITNCCVCGLSFLALGKGNYVTLSNLNRSQSRIILSDEDLEGDYNEKWEFFMGFRKINIAHKQNAEFIERMNGDYEEA